MNLKNSTWNRFLGTCCAMGIAFAASPGYAELGGYFECVGTDTLKIEDEASGVEMSIDCLGYGAWVGYYVSEDEVEPGVVGVASEFYHIDLDAMEQDLGHFSVTVSENLAKEELKLQTQDLDTLTIEYKLNTPTR